MQLPVTCLQKAFLGRFRSGTTILDQSLKKRLGQKREYTHYKPELPPHLSIQEQHYYGNDGRSLYLSKETRDMRGLTCREAIRVLGVECMKL